MGIECDGGSCNGSAGIVVGPKDTCEWSGSRLAEYST